VTRPLLLDLFSGAGGAAMGYHRAGFDVVGVDVIDQPRYPFTFVRNDALSALCDFERLSRIWSFTAIHASPPCQDHSRLASMPTYRTHGTAGMLEDARRLMVATGVPWVIENVPGAGMRADYKLCGCMFGLPGLRRERWFETSWRGFAMRSPCSHSDATVTVAGHAGGSSKRDGISGYSDTTGWKRAMGIDWMTGKELAQAIPPAYTEYIGAQLIEAIGVAT
jgi:DNA (cytosine-5)-methyltransferase 1